MATRDEDLLSAKEELAADLKTYDGITKRVVGEAGMTRVAFEKMEPEQRIYLVHRYYGKDIAKIYESEIPNQVVVLNAAVSQGSFSRTFANINESTDIYASMSSVLNGELYGLYNSSTKYFILLETYRSLMKSIGSIDVADSTLVDISIPATSIDVPVPSLGDYKATIQASEIRSILDNQASAIIGSVSATTTILTEGLVLALLDINKETESTSIINNFTTPPSHSMVGDNLVVIWPSKIVLDEGWECDGKTLKANLSGNSSAILPDSNLINTSNKQRVSFDITEYISGRLTVFLKGKPIFNEAGYRGRVSIDILPGTSRYSDLAFVSSDLKANINNIEIRDIS